MPDEKGLRTISEMMDDCPVALPIIIIFMIVLITGIYGICTGQL